MYPGGADERAEDIDAGAGRSPGELVSDVTSADAALERAWTAASHETWTQGLGVRNAGPTTVSDFVFLRWREVEVHMADLGLNGQVEHWDVLPPAYLDGDWARMTAWLDKRLPADVTAVLVPGDRPSRAYGTGERTVYVHGTAGRLLAWMMDRGGDPSWPTLSSWSY